jgi:hypothetical protein
MGIVHFRRRNRQEIRDIILQCLGDKTRLFQAFKNQENIESDCEALSRLVKKGYDHWLLERKYESVKLEDPTILDMSVRYAEVLHAYFRLKFLLRDLMSDIRKLILTCNSLLSEAEQVCRQFTRCSFDPKEYRRGLEDYYERYVKPLDRMEEDNDSIDQLIDDLEIILDHLRKLRKGASQSM